MAIISDPFAAAEQRQLSNNALAQAIRTDIINEYEAIIGYEAHAQAASDNRVKEVLRQIAEDEKKHVGQLLELLQLLSPKERQLLEQGKQTARQNLGTASLQTGQQTTSPGLMQ